MADPGQWIGPGRIGRALAPNRGATRRRRQSPLRRAPVLARVSLAIYRLSLAIYRRSSARYARPGRPREPLPAQGPCAAPAALFPRITPSRLWGDLAHVSLTRGCSVNRLRSLCLGEAPGSRAHGGWRSAGPAPAAPRGRPVGARVRLDPVAPTRERQKRGKAPLHCSNSSVAAKSKAGKGHKLRRSLTRRSRADINWSLFITRP